MAESIRMQQLKRLAGAMPVANQTVANQLKEAQATQFQNAIAKAPAGSGMPQAQQLGANQVAEQGKIDLNANQETQQQVGQVAQIGLEQQGNEAAQRVGTASRAAEAQQRNYAGRLNALGNNLKNELLDKQLAFEKNQAGQAVLNERQLADYAVLKSKNEAEFNGYKQQMEQMYQKKVQFYQTVSKKLENAAKAGYTAEGKKLDFESKKKILEYSNEMKRKAQEAANAMSANASKWAAGGTIVGAVVGGIYGGPGGAMAGGAAGGAVGGYIGNSVG